MFEKLDLLPPEEAFDAPMQMALDEVILRCVVRPTLRIYRWDRSCITFGYFQKLNEVRRVHPDLPLVRRWTGGGIVEHGNDLTFSLMIPKGCAAAEFAPALFYRRLHTRMATLLAEVSGAEICLADKEAARGGASCFLAPAGDDLLWNGRKILGGAQRRCAGALLYQGSLQGTDMSLSLTPGRLAGAISGDISCCALGGAIREGAVELARRRYYTEEWNARR